MPILRDTKQVKQQHYWERRYSIKSFLVPSKTYNKVSIQQYYIVGTPFSLLNLSPSPLWLAFPPQMMTLKHPTPFYSSKSHKFDKYDKAPYIVSCYYQSYKTNLKAVLSCFPQANSLTSPTKHQQRYFKVYIFQESCLQLGKYEKTL